MGMTAEDPCDLKIHQENLVHEEKQVQKEVANTRKKKKTSPHGVQNHIGTLKKEPFFLHNDLFTTIKGQFHVGSK